MKKSTMQEGFTGSGSARAQDNTGLIFLVMMIVMAAMAIGAWIGTPSKADKQGVEAMRAEYQALKTGIEKAAVAPREDWSCTQGKVDVNLKTVEQVVPGWMSFSSYGHVEEGPAMRKVIKTVSEHTTMDCNRQVKQYTE